TGEPVLVQYVCQVIAEFAERVRTAGYLRLDELLKPIFRGHLPGARGRGGEGGFQLVGAGAQGGEVRLELALAGEHAAMGAAPLRKKRTHRVCVVGHRVCASRRSASFM